MPETNVELAELELLKAHLTQRARVCYAMVVGGMISLAAGVIMLVVGLSGDQVIWFTSPGGLKITAGGFGAVTMLASVAWGYIAYRSRPEIRYTSPHYKVLLGRQDDDEPIRRRLRRNVD